MGNLLGMRKTTRPRWIAPLSVAAALAFAVPAAHAEAIEFNRDIRPILSNNCYACHGPDEETRAARLRLDTFEGATARTRSGDYPIVPGDPAASELLYRVSPAAGPDIMPPMETGKTLTAEEIATLEQWIAEGAEYQKHWSYVAPARPDLPAVSDPAWPRNGIDHFILARLDAEGLSPSPEADKATLLRRVYLDLIGLPPSPAEVEAFLADDSAVAYERVVDRLLASPRYGERWARLWLDIARYADTKGYEKDDPRTIWRYRDWVIQAFNADMPFDQFTREQLAGDLLPDPTLDQLIATAFHRNTMTNDEGGTDDEEFRNAAVVDRVNTTFEAWMGVTMACAQCHTHKYDPITLNEYFEAFAFFNQTADADRTDEAPTIATPTPAQQRAKALLSERLEQASAQFEAAVAARHARRLAAWERTLLAQSAAEVTLGDWHVMGPVSGGNVRQLHESELDGETQVDITKTYGGYYRFEHWPHLRDGEVHVFEEENSAYLFYRTVTVASPQRLAVYFGSDDAIKVRLNDEVVHDHMVMRRPAPDQDRVELHLEPGTNHLLVKVSNGGSTGGFFFRIADTVLDNALMTALATAPAERTDEQRRMVLQRFADETGAAAPEKAKADAINDEIAALLAEIPTTPIMQELPEDDRRVTRVQFRGNFLDLGDEVAPGTPAVLHPFPEDAPRNRLGLAQWLTSRDNPLTARVTVNRWWEQFFGAGIVETLEEFGSQGDLPTHPELLDWLAVAFMEQGWSMKDLARKIVLSATYRQDARITPALREQDPYNRLLARGPRFRLEAEMLRDQALAAAGLLSDTMYGPSVMPYQPEGIWQIVYSSEQWETSEGDDRYRRGLYTYWRRTSPYPSFTTFDAPSREVCEIRRTRTNTPLQALTMMNDPVYIEAAQALARRVLHEGGPTDGDRLAYAFQLVTARVPTEAERNRLARLLASERVHYADAPEDAHAMASDPLGPLPDWADPADLAAWTVVCSVILNLDETLTKG